MKNITEITKLILDRVFSFPVFCIVFILGFFYFLSGMMDEQNKRLAEERAISATCYSMGMVDVDTDGGKRCVNPRNLNEPKIVERVVVTK